MEGSAAPTSPCTAASADGRSEPGGCTRCWLPSSLTNPSHGKTERPRVRHIPRDTQTVPSTVPGTRRHLTGRLHEVKGSMVFWRCSHSIPRPPRRRASAATAGAPVVGRNLATAVAVAVAAVAAVMVAARVMRRAAARATRRAGAGVTPTVAASRAMQTEVARARRRVVVMRTVAARAMRRAGARAKPMAGERASPTSVGGTEEGRLPRRGGEPGSRGPRKPRRQGRRRSSFRPSLPFPRMRPRQRAEAARRRLPAAGRESERRQS